MYYYLLYLCIPTLLLMSQRSKKHKESESKLSDFKKNFLNIGSVLVVMFALIGAGYSAGVWHTEIRYNSKSKDTQSIDKSLNRASNIEQQISDTIYIYSGEESQSNIEGKSDMYLSKQEFEEFKKDLNLYLKKK